MKNRKLYARLFSDPGFAPLMSQTQILYLAMLCAADDLGFVDINPVMLKVNAFPAKSIPEEAIVGMTDDLVRAGLIVRVKSETGQNLAAIVGFQRDQKKPNPRRGKTTILQGSIISEVQAALEGKAPPRPEPQETPVKPEKAKVPANIESQVLQKGPDTSPRVIASPPPATVNFLQPATFELVSDAAWQTRVERWRNNGVWLDHYGPEPGHPGCQVPRHVLAMWEGEKA